MPTLCINYEYIEKDGFSIDQGEYVYNWDDSEYKNDDDNDEDDF